MEKSLKCLSRIWENLLWLKGVRWFGFWLESFLLLSQLPQKTKLATKMTQNNYLTFLILTVTHTVDYESGVTIYAIQPQHIFLFILVIYRIYSSNFYEMNFQFGLFFHRKTWYYRFKTSLYCDSLKPWKFIFQRVFGTTIRKYFRSLWRWL